MKACTLFGERDSKIELKTRLRSYFPERENHSHKRLLANSEPPELSSSCSTTDDHSLGATKNERKRRKRRGEKAKQSSGANPTEEMPPKVEMAVPLQDAAMPYHGLPTIRTSPKDISAKAAPAILEELVSKNPTFRWRPAQKAVVDGESLGLGETSWGTVKMSPLVDA